MIWSNTLRWIYRLATELGAALSMQCERADAGARDFAALAHEHSSAIAVAPPPPPHTLATPA